MTTLHGVGPSPFVRKVRVAMAEKGLSYDHEPVMPGMAPEGYEKLHPLKKIPVYQDGDFVLPDSSCILQYLERVQPNPALYPSDPKQYGRALWYEEYSDSKLTETVGPIFFNRVVKPRIFQQEPEEDVVKQKSEELLPLLDYLEGELADDREFLAGGQFSVADIAVGSIFVNYAHTGESVDASRWPKLAAYVARIHARPSFKALIEEERAMFG